jgi:hypothetical protein
MDYTVRVRVHAMSENLPDLVESGIVLIDIYLPLLTFSLLILPP